MLLFRSEEESLAWCHAHEFVPGAIVPVAQLARLAARWYGDRLDPDWRPRTLEQSQAVLEQHGLTGDFSRL
jgi:hypothetical protein